MRQLRVFTLKARAMSTSAVAVAQLALTSLCNVCLMAFHSSLWGLFALMAFIKVYSCQENGQQEPLVLKDFHSYALNVGNTLVDLLRREISMLGKISPSPSQPSNTFGGIPPSPGSPVAPVGIPLPPGSVYPPAGSVLPAPAILAPGTPAAAVTATAGSTVYSIGANYAPLTVINIYRDLPPSATPINNKAPQGLVTPGNTSEFHQQPSSELPNYLKPIDSSNVSSAGEIPDASSQMAQQNSSSDEVPQDSKTSAGEESQNIPGLSGAENNLPAQPEQLGNTDVPEAETTVGDEESVTTTTQPATS